MHAPPPEERTAAERRYVLTVGALCAERNEKPATSNARSAADQVGKARAWRRIEAEHAEDFEALKAPKRFRSTAERMTTLELECSISPTRPSRPGARAIGSSSRPSSPPPSCRRALRRGRDALGVPVCASA